MNSQKIRSDQKLFINAIVTGNTSKMAEILADKPHLLNAILYIKPEQGARRNIYMNMTALGYAIYLNSAAVVEFLFTYQNLRLSAGQVLFSEPKEWAKLRGNTEALDVIIKFENSKLTASNHVAQDPEPIAADLSQQIYEALRLNNLALATAHLKVFAQNLFLYNSTDDTLILKLIDLLDIELKRTRWVLVKNNQKNTIAGSRDDNLEENIETINKQKSLTANKIELIKKMIVLIFPDFSTYSESQLLDYYNNQTKQRKKFHADYSDDSDADDESNLQDSSNHRTAHYTAIIAASSADNNFAAKTMQAGLLVKLTEICSKTTISADEVKKTNRTLFSSKRHRAEIATTSDHSTKYVAQFRGVNYMSDRWNTTARRHHYTMEETHKPQYSESVLKTLPYNPYTDLSAENDFHENLSQAQSLHNAAIELKQQHTKLQATAPVIEECVALKNAPYLFNNTGDFLQSEYTNGISQHLLAIKERRAENIGNIRNHTINSFNPAISTSDCPNHALRYALGLKTYYADNFSIRYNADGSIVNSHVGKVYIIMQKAEEFTQPEYVNHVLKMAHEARVPISKNGGIDIASELENDYISYIPHYKVAYQLRLKFPCFAGPYRKIFQAKYGLTKDLYESFATLITRTWDSDPNNDAHLEAIELLKEWLCAYYEVLLLGIAQGKARELGGELVYIKHDGTYTNNPDFVPFNAGDAHLPGRNITHLLQNVRAIIAEHPNLRTAGDTSLILDTISEQHKPKMHECIVTEPTKPEGFAKIEDPSTRQFYQALQQSSDEDASKKAKISTSILNQFKRTLPQTVQVDQPLRFSKKMKSI